MVLMEATSTAAFTSVKYVTVRAFLRQRLVKLLRSHVTRET